MPACVRRHVHSLRCVRMCASRACACALRLHVRCSLTTCRSHVCVHVCLCMHVCVHMCKVQHCTLLTPSKCSDDGTLKQVYGRWSRRHLADPRPRPRPGVRVPPRTRAIRAFNVRMRVDLCSQTCACMYRACVCACTWVACAWQTCVCMHACVHMRVYACTHAHVLV